MQLMRVGDAGSERPAVLTADGRMLDASRLGRDYDGPFFASGGLEDLERRVLAGDLPELDAKALRIGPPLVKPEKIVCVGLNYRDHAEETGATPPSEPVIFLKAPNTMIGPNDDVAVPPGSTKTDWEIELAVVIGRRARYLRSVDDAWDCIAGYAIANDVSEREYQLERGGTWDKGKGCETFNPLGPVLVTRDEVPDPQVVELRLSVNGVERQHSSTANMIFPVAYLVWYTSQFMVLEPGDVMNTGTPAGVALARNEGYLQPGDVMELSAAGLGTQRQRVVAAVVSR